MKKTVAFLLCVAVLAGCMPAPQNALELTPETMQDRQLQTRRFDTTNKSTMLAAAAAVLQDLGFTLEESEIPLGVLTASKQRSAVSAGQVTGAIFIAILGGLVGVNTNTPLDSTQNLRVSMVMRENSSKDSIVRVTFQRVVITDQGTISRAEQIKDEEIYKEFFERLAKSVFLEAHEI